LGARAQLSGAIGIAQGGAHGCAWKEDGSVWVGGFHACLLSEGKVVCWGRNYSGQLGNGTTSNDVSAPVAVQF
jgi:alpha-tubulin suppressor-like RCC1 family protein